MRLVVDAEDDLFVENKAGCELVPEFFKLLGGGSGGIRRVSDDLLASLLNCCSQSLFFGIELTLPLLGCEEGSLDAGRSREQ